jgi:hypothetical protein
MPNYTTEYVKARYTQLIILRVCLDVKKLLELA